MTTNARHSKRRLVALAALVSLVFVACSSGDNTKKASGGATTTPANGAADPKGVLRVGLDLVRQSGGGAGLALDPLKATGSNGNADDGFWYLLYGRLMRLNPDGSLTPDLAKSATIIDSNTIEIVLRKGLTFSDGTPLDADALKAALDRALNNSSQAEVGFLERFFSLKSVTVTAPDTVRLSIPDGTAASWYDQYIPAWQTSITKPGQTDFTTPIGAGPMKLVSYERGQKLVLTKNERYWNAAAVKVAGYEFIHISGADAQAGTNALRSGQVDITFTQPDQLSSLTGNLKPYALVSNEQTVSLYMCKKDGPLADPRVRKAINKGIDRNSINKAIFGDTAKPATQLWPAGHKFNDPALDKTLAYDPTAAKELLKQAGFDKGFAVDLYFIPFFGLSQTAEVFQQEMAALGITVNIKNGANFVTEYLQPQRPGLGLYPGSAAGVDKLRSWSGDTLGNVCRYDDPDLNALIDKLATISQSDPQAVDLWHQVDKLVVDKALGGFLLFRSQLGAYNSDRVGNMAGWHLGAWIMPDPFKTFVKAQ